MAAEPALINETTQVAARPELIAIVGPTASGKTALAIDIAEEFNGEIICADSRTVYKGMDIGTAKPTPAEQARVRHWGLDLVEPNERFSVADFKLYAHDVIADIQARGKVPFLVGGTGLYIDAVMYDFTFGHAVNKKHRQTLESMSLEQLVNYCVKNNISLPRNDKNKRHLISSIERFGNDSISKSPLKRNHYIVGIATKMNTLRTRIETRAEHIFDGNVEEEASMLGKKYGWNSEAMTGNIYPLIKKHLKEDVTLVEIKDQFSTLDYQLAKRQMTWFRRNPDIIWASLGDARAYLEQLFTSE